MVQLTYIIVVGVIAVIIGILVCAGRAIVKKEKRKSRKNRPTAAHIPRPNE